MTNQLQLELIVDDMDDDTWHTCPYREDMHDDYVTLCDCDAESIQNCLGDI